MSYKIEILELYSCGWRVPFARSWFMNNLRRGCECGFTGARNKMAGDEKESRLSGEVCVTAKEEIWDM